MFLEGFIQIESPILFLNLILWMTNIIVTILIVFYIFYVLYVKKEVKKMKEERINTLNIITWLLLLLFVGIANILTISYRFLVMEESLEISLEWISNILIYIGIFIKILFLEHTLHKNNYYKRYYFSVISLIAVIMITLVAPAVLKVISPLQIIFIIVSFFNYSILPILYFFLAIKTVGKSRTKSLKISAGTVFLGLGLLFRPQNLEGYRIVSDLLNTLIDYTYITAPISILLAVILIFDSIRKKSI